MVIERAMSEMMKNPRAMEKAQAKVGQHFDKTANVDQIGLNELTILVTGSCFLEPASRSFCRNGKFCTN